MYKRVLLKLSGEALGSKESKDIFDVEYLSKVADVIKILHAEGVQVAVVIGAGNIWRGKVAEKIGIERIPADYMGMLGTVINAVALASNLKGSGVPSLVFSALPPIADVTLRYDQNKVIEALEGGNVCFLSGGTGLPFFTTDTAAVQRAIETKCDAILMAKNGVKGVYDKDPLVYSDAKFYPEITFDEMEQLNIKIMDATAISMVKTSNLEILVFSMAETDNVLRAARGENVGTVCKKER